ncbi:AAA family ATPase [Candidatus Frankia alpina]|uniref:ATP-binding protein n=1 Tax=Candidatus Frankia alpina TaxID=2699483 RepID=A0A4S5ESM3_9ACTN|nr:ATP-binding protein [Candidatus Frankia alpina]THJ75447.1 ATP-binding protein [Candidatus Frankia alpina]
MVLRNHPAGGSPSPAVAVLPAAPPCAPGRAVWYGGRLGEGAAGIGKTVLLAAARDHAGSRGVRVLSATGAELEREYAFGIVRQLLEPVWRRADRTQRAELFEGAAALAEPVLVEHTDGTGGTLGSILHGLFWVCANLADRGPLLLTIDDVHWADDASLRFIAYLARRTTDLPVLLLLAARPVSSVGSDLVASTLAGLRLETLRPNVLSIDAVGELVRARLSPDADDEFCRACAHASGGNPFLLAEAILALRADKVRPVAAATGRLDALRADNVSMRCGPTTSRVPGWSGWPGSARTRPGWPARSPSSARMRRSGTSRASPTSPRPARRSRSTR